MRMKFLLPLAAVVSLASAPAMAAAPQLQRAGAPTEESAELRGGVGVFFISFLALSAIIFAIIKASKTGNDQPNSP